MDFKNSLPLENWERTTILFLMCELTRHNKKSEKWQVKLINEDVPKMKITGVQYTSTAFTTLLNLWSDADT